MEATSPPMLKAMEGYSEQPDPKGPKVPVVGNAQINYFYGMSLRFGNQEKLKSRKVIEQLFSEGKSMKKFPVKLLFLPLQGSKKHQVTFAVPKRNFKLAVSRNRIKRQLREAYRLHKHLLTDDNGKKFALLFLYISKDKLQYTQLEASVAVLLKKLGDEKI